MSSELAGIDSLITDTLLSAGGQKERPPVSSCGNMSSKLKKIPNGKIILDIHRGKFQDHISTGDFAIVIEAGIKKYYEITKVNSRTIFVEKEKIKDGKLERYICQIKNVIGIISIKK